MIPATGFSSIRIVKGIIVSDGITFTYNTSRSAGAAAGVGPTAAGAALRINLNVNIGGLASMEQAQAALQTVPAGQVGW